MPGMLKDGQSGYAEVLHLLGLTLSLLAPM